MDEPINAGRETPTRSTPPELGKRLLDLWPLVIIGTTGWVVALLVLLITGHDGVWLYTTLCGAGLGIVGMVLVRWQRAASRRGARGAQRGL